MTKLVVHLRRPAGGGGGGGGRRRPFKFRVLLADWEAAPDPGGAGGRPGRVWFESGVMRLDAAEAGGGGVGAGGDPAGPGAEG